MTTTIYVGDATERLRELPGESVRCVVTSPPYWRQRDYLSEGQIGLEKTPEGYVSALVSAFSAVRRVMTVDGTLWLNIGEKWASGGNGGGGSMMAKRGETAWAHSRNNKGWRSPPAGFKDKDMTGIPWLVAHALRSDGWWLRQCVIWSKTVATEPTRIDRPSISHEYLFQLTKSADSGTRDPGEPWFHSSVWTVNTQHRKTDHPAPMPEEIARRCIVSVQQRRRHRCRPIRRVWNSRTRGAAPTARRCADRDQPGVRGDGETSHRSRRAFAFYGSFMPLISYLPWCYKHQKDRRT